MITLPGKVHCPVCCQDITETHDGKTPVFSCPDCRFCFRANVPRMVEAMLRRQPVAATVDWIRQVQGGPGG